MRILVFTKHPRAEVKRLLKRHGLTPVRSRPDIILCWGGDGTYLLAEHKHPGIPKLIVRKDSICRTCQGRSLRQVIPLLVKGKYRIREEPMLQATIGKRIIPRIVNDLVVRNKHPAHALRFSVRLGKASLGEQIGDGVVVCTPFGSSAYYESITRTTIPRGIGVAMNNTTQEHPAYMVDDDVAVTVRITRGDATVTVDTLPRILTARAGDTITIRASRERARLITF